MKNSLDKAVKLILKEQKNVQLSQRAMVESSHPWDNEIKEPYSSRSSRVQKKTDRYSGSATSRSELRNLKLQNSFEEAANPNNVSHGSMSKSQKVNLEYGENFEQIFE